LQYPALGLTAEDCSHSKANPCEDRQFCKYKTQKAKVLSSDFKILNLPYLLTEANLVGQFSGTPLMILDEADMVEDALLKTISLKITDRTLAFLEKGNIKPPRFKTKFEAWQDWALSITVHLSSWITKLEDEINDIEDRDNSKEFRFMLKDLSRLRSLELKIDRFLKLVDNTWIFNPTNRYWEFQPTWLTPEMSEQFLFRHADKFVFMSATFPYSPVFCKLLGINIAQTDWIELPCQFPVENRRVHFLPKANMVYKEEATETPKVIEGIKVILDKYPKHKGIIHCVSYKLRDAILSLNTGRLISHEAIDRDLKLKEFMQSKEPLVLVSPSYERGISLDHKLARFVIWAKIPYMPLGDKVVSKRIHSSQIGQEWYQATACQTIVQGCGRAVRANDDWADSWILDKQFDRLLEKPFMFPMWFREAIVFV
jgi:Rad3-related DNA helicase